MAVGVVGGAFIATNRQPSRTPRSTVAYLSSDETLDTWTLNGVVFALLNWSRRDGLAIRVRSRALEAVSMSRKRRSVVSRWRHSGTDVRFAAASSNADGDVVVAWFEERRGRDALFVASRRRGHKFTRARFVHHARGNEEIAAAVSSSGRVFVASSRENSTSVHTASHGGRPLIVGTVRANLRIRNLVLGVTGRNRPVVLLAEEGVGEAGTNSYDGRYRVRVVDFGAKPPTSVELEAGDRQMPNARFELISAECQNRLVLAWTGGDDGRVVKVADVTSAGDVSPAHALDESGSVLTLSCGSQSALAAWIHSDATSDERTVVAAVVQEGSVPNREEVAQAVPTALQAVHLELQQPALLLHSEATGVTALTLRR